MTIERLNEIARENAFTGTYGDCLLFMAPATWHRLRRIPSGPERNWAGPFAGRLNLIPVVQDDQLPAGRWELIRRRRVDCSDPEHYHVAPEMIEYGMLDMSDRSSKSRSTNVDGNERSS